MAVWDDIKKQHKKIRKKGFKAMVGYFWDYYKIPTAVIIATIIFTVCLIKDMSSNLPYGFYAVMINSTLHPEGQDIGEDFAQYAGIDTENYYCLVDGTLTLSTSTYNTYDVSTQEKLMAITAAGDLDVMIADQSVFELYARNSYMTDLRDVLSEEELSKYDGYIYYFDKAIIDAIEDGSYEASYDASAQEDASDEASSDATVSEDDISYMLGISTPDSIITEENFVLPDPETMEDPIPVGIVLTDSAFMKSTSTYAGSVPIFGIIGNSSRTDVAIRFLEYMFSYTPSESKS